MSEPIVLYNSKKLSEVLIMATSCGSNGFYINGN